MRAGRALVLALRGSLPLPAHQVPARGDACALGSTHLGIEASDLAVVVVALVALREGLRAGFAPLRPALPLWIASAALVVWILVRSEITRAPRDSGEVLRVRAARDLCAVDPAAAGRLGGRGRGDRGVERRRDVFALLQFFGLDIADAWAAGRRQPSFLGHSDFAALSALALGIGFAAVLLAEQAHRLACGRHRRARAHSLGSERRADRDRRGNGGVALRHPRDGGRSCFATSPSAASSSESWRQACSSCEAGTSRASCASCTERKGGADDQHRDLLAPHVARVHRLPHLARPSGRRRGLGGIHRSRRGRPAAAGRP